MKRHFLYTAAVLLLAGCQSIPEGEPPAGAITSNQVQTATPEQAALSLAAFFLMEQDLPQEIIVADHPGVWQVFAAASRVVSLKAVPEAQNTLEYDGKALVLRRNSDRKILWQFEGI